MQCSWLVEVKYINWCTHTVMDSGHFSVTVTLIYIYFWWHHSSDMCIFLVFFLAIGNKIKHYAFFEQIIYWVSDTFNINIIMYDCDIYWEVHMNWNLCAACLSLDSSKRKANIILIIFSGNLTTNIFDHYQIL